MTVNREKSSARAPTPRFLVLQVGYILALIILSAYFRIFPSPELMLLLLLTVLYGQVRSTGFLKDFAPFVLLLLSYQSLRGFADNLTPMEINITGIIGWERAIFGGIIPAAWVQQHLAGRWFTGLLDAATTLFYVSHFVLPILAAYIIWQKKRWAYWPFVNGLVALSFGGFLCYLFFPTAPPWWAHEYGYLPEAVDPARFLLPSLTAVVSPNPVAAMPSLHCAYPTYVALFVIWLWRGSGAVRWLLILPVGVAFSVIYLGHHYVIDIVAGFLFGLGFFLIVKGLTKHTPPI